MTAKICPYPRPTSHQVPCRCTVIIIAPRAYPPLGRSRAIWIAPEPLSPGLSRRRRISRPSSARMLGGAARQQSRWPGQAQPQQRFANLLFARKTAVVRYFSLQSASPSTSTGGSLLHKVKRVGALARDKKRRRYFPPQYRAFPGVRGNGIASRTFASPVTYASVRSNPSPNPAWGTVP
jgi:hypothetical protein